MRNLNNILILCLAGGLSFSAFSDKGNLGISLQQVIKPVPQNSDSDYTDRGDYYLFKGKKVFLLKSRSQFSVSFKDKKENRSQISGEKRSFKKGYYSTKTINSKLDIVQLSSELLNDSDSDSLKNIYLEDPLVTSVNNVYKIKHDGNQLFITGNILVKFNDTSKANEIIAKYGCTIESKLSENEHLLSRQFKRGADILKIANDMTQEPSVKWAEPEFLCKPQKLMIPNDTYFNKQWSLLNNGGDLAPAGVDIGATRAWDKGPFDSSLVLAVIDDGIDPSHPDLRLAPGGKNFVHDTVNNEFQPISPSLKHGTSCAGIACASGNNNIGISGICPYSKILPIRLGDSAFLITPTDFINALNYASQHADVISISLSYPEFSSIEDKITEISVSARNGKGMPVFCASGNSNSPFYQLTFNLPDAGSYYFAFLFKNDSTASTGNDFVAIDNLKIIDSNSTVIYFQPFAGPSLPAGWITYGGDLSKYPDTSAEVTGWNETNLMYCSGYGDQYSVISGTGKGKWTELCMPLRSFSKKQQMTFRINQLISPKDSFFIKIYNSNRSASAVTPIDWGNPDSVDTDICFPASSDSAIAVGASTDFDFRTYYSQYNTNNTGKTVEFLAPSGGGFKDIATTDRVGKDGYDSTSDYTLTFSGTSAATPLAAGLGMLILSKNPELSRNKVLEVMRHSCKKIGNVPYVNGFNREYGYGRIDATNALKNLPPVIRDQKAPIYIVENCTLSITPSMLNIFDTETPDGPFSVNVLAGTGYTVNGSQISILPSFDSIKVPVIVNDSDYASDPFVITVKAKKPNSSPSFSKGSNIVTNEDIGAVAYENWAKNISFGSDSDVQNVNFYVNADNITLFSVQPSINQSTGDLSFTTAPDIYGITNVKVILRDNGGTACGGIDSFVTSFTIAVNPVNDPPSFRNAGDLTVKEDCGSFTSGWATEISAGPHESQKLQFSLTPDNISLFSVLPHVDSITGNISFTTAPDAFGTANVRVLLRDDGGIASGGCDSFVTSFKITVLPVNDPPRITCSGNLNILECDSSTLDIEAEDIDNSTIKMAIKSLPRIAVCKVLTDTHFKVAVNPDYGDTGSFPLIISAKDDSVEIFDTVSITVGLKKRASVTISGIDDSTEVLIGGAGSWRGKLARTGSGKIDSIFPGSYIFQLSRPSRRATVFRIKLKPGADTSITVYCRNPVQMGFCSPDTLKSGGIPFIVSGIRSCCIEDLNEDDNKELLSVDNTGKVSIYSVINGNINLVGQKTFSPDIRCVRAVDYDCDGDLDLIYGFFNGQISLQRNRGLMRFDDTLVNLFKTDSGCTGFSLEKLNNDDKPDFLLSFQNGTIKTAVSGSSTYVVSGPDTLDNRGFAPGMNPVILTMDITGDDNPDMITAQNDSMLTWYQRKDSSFEFRGALNTGGKTTIATSASLSPYYEKPELIPGFLLTTGAGNIIRFTGKVRADLNNDGKVDIVDLQQMGMKWNSRENDIIWNPSINLNLDADGYGKQCIDILDLQILGNCWGLEW
jgi:subtilisin family serine protease